MLFPHLNTLKGTAAAAIIILNTRITAERSMGEAADTVHDLIVREVSDMEKEPALSS